MAKDVIISGKTRCQPIYISQAESDRTAESSENARCFPIYRFKHETECTMDDNGNTRCFPIYRFQHEAKCIMDNNGNTRCFPNIICQLHQSFIYYLATSKFHRKFVVSNSVTQSSNYYSTYKQIFYLYLVYINTMPHMYYSTDILIHRGRCVHTFTVRNNEIMFSHETKLHIMIT